MEQLKPCRFCDGETRQIRSKGGWDGAIAYMNPERCELVVAGDRVGEYARYQTFRIQFCPICGRQLETPNEDGFPVKVGSKYKRKK